MKNLPPPSKSWGQNYLINKGIKQKIVNALNLKQNDIIIEIGAGKGALTDLLASYENKIYAIEPHSESFSYLLEKFKQFSNVVVMREDATLFDFSKIIDENQIKYKIVGNLPYNVSTKIFSNIIHTVSIDFYAVFMFQKEVAKRLVAKPKTKDYSALSVFSSLCGNSKILFDVSPGSFYPKPKVTSSVISFQSIQNDFIWSKFKPFLMSVFSNRRKTMSNIFKSIFGKNQADTIFTMWGKDRYLRPADYSPTDYSDLYSILTTQNFI